MVDIVDLTGDDSDTPTQHATQYTTQYTTQDAEQTCRDAVMEVFPDLCPIYLTWLVGHYDSDSARIVDGLLAQERYMGDFPRRDGQVSGPSLSALGMRYPHASHRQQSQQSRDVTLRSRALQEHRGRRKRRRSEFDLPNSLLEDDENTIPVKAEVAAKTQECQCCFGDLPENDMVHCDGDESHVGHPHPFIVSIDTDGHRFHSGSAFLAAGKTLK